MKKSKGAKMDAEKNLKRNENSHIYQLRVAYKKELAAGNKDGIVEKLHQLTQAVSTYNVKYGANVSIIPEAKNGHATAGKSKGSGNAQPTTEVAPEAKPAAQPPTPSVQQAIAIASGLRDGRPVTYRCEKADITLAVVRDYLMIGIGDEATAISKADLIAMTAWLRQHCPCD